MVTDINQKDDDCDISEISWNPQGNLGIWWNMSETVTVNWLQKFEILWNLWFNISTEIYIFVLNTTKILCGLMAWMHCFSEKTSFHVKLSMISQYITQHRYVKIDNFFFFYVNFGTWKVTTFFSNECSLPNTHIGSHLLFPWKVSLRIT